MPLSYKEWDPLEGVPPENRLDKALEIIGLWMNGELSYLPESVKKETAPIPLPPDLPSGVEEWSAPEEAADPLSGAKLAEVMGSSIWEYDSSIGLFRLPGSAWTYDPKNNSYYNNGKVRAPLTTPPGYVTGMKYPGDPL